MKHTTRMKRVCVYVSRHHFTMKSKLCYTFFSRRLIRITSKLIYTSICNVYFYMLKTVCWDFVNFKNNLSVWPFGWNCREKKKCCFIQKMSALPLYAAAAAAVDCYNEPAGIEIVDWTPTTRATKNKTNNTKHWQRVAALTFTPYTKYEVKSIKI